MRAILCRQFERGSSQWSKRRLSSTFGHFSVALGEVSSPETAVEARSTPPHRRNAPLWHSLLPGGGWHGRTFASSAAGSGDEGPPAPSQPGASLSYKQKKELEAFFYQICGPEEAPPTPEELEALQLLRHRFHQVYGPAALPTAAAVQEIFDEYMRSVEMQWISEQQASTEDTRAAAATEEEQEESGPLAASGEVWDEYVLSDEEKAQVEALSRAPKKVQRSALQQDLKAAMREPEPEDLEDGEGGDEDRERMERVFDMRTVSVNRTCKKNKGGGLFRFQAFVVVGNGDGVIGYGMGKASEVVGAIDKAYRDAERNLYYVERYRGHTVFHETEGKCTKTKVKVWPRPSGSGIRCNDTLANICALAGIKDIRAKVHGSRHKMNMVKAFFQALDKQKTPDEIAREKGLVAREIAGALR